MASVITNFIVSIWILVKGILLALLDMVAAVWHLIRDINLGFYHIFKGIVGFLWSTSVLHCLQGCQTLRRSRNDCAYPLQPTSSSSLCSEVATMRTLPTSTRKQSRRLQVLPEPTVQLR